MSDCIVVEWTCGSLDEARFVARYLVEEGVVACAQIVPWIESIYLWNGSVNTEQECKVVLKAPRVNYPAIERAILENCRYELPEITYRTIEGGLEPYLDWVNECAHEMSS